MSRVWLPVPEFAGYFISNDGYVGSGRTQKNGEVCTLPYKVLKPICGRYVNLRVGNGKAVARSPRTLYRDVWGRELKTVPIPDTRHISDLPDCQE